MSTPKFRVAIWYDVTPLLLARHANQPLSLALAAGALGVSPALSLSHRPAMSRLTSTRLQASSLKLAPALASGRERGRFSLPLASLQT